MKQLNWKPVNVATLNDLSPEQQGRMADYITERYDTWRSLRRGYEWLWLTIDRHLNQYDPQMSPILRVERNNTIDDPGVSGSKLKMSNVYAHREGIVASMCKYLFANAYDFFDIQPMDPIDAPSTEAVKQYMMWLFDIMQFDQAFKPFLRGLATYGTAIASYEWVEETAIRWKTEYYTDPDTGVEYPIRYQAPDVLYSAPKFTPINLYRAVIDPMAFNMRSATLIFQKLITPHEILANPAYSGVTEDWVFGTPDAGPDQDAVYDLEREIARGDNTFSGAAAYKGRKKVYEAWGDFTDGFTLYQNYVAEVLDNRLIRFEPNPYNMPYKPFVIARYSIEDGSVYGKSPLASITAIQAAYDTLVNQVLDCNAMHNERPILIQSNTLVSDKNDKKAVPPLGKNVIWRVRDVQAVRRMSDPDFRGVTDSISLLQILDAQMKLNTGDNELMSGGGGINDQYATTGHVVTVADAGNTRFNLYASTIESEAVVPVLEMTIDLLRQRTLEPKTFQPTDPTQGQSVEFHPELLLNDVAFSMRGASYNATKQLQVASMQNFYTLLTQNPYTAQLMNWARVIIDFGDALSIRSIRSQLNPMALQQIQATPPQPSFWQQVAGLFQAKQQDQTQEPQLGNAATLPSAPAFGGSNPASTNQAAFNATPTPGAANGAGNVPG